MIVNQELFFNDSATRNSYFVNENRYKDTSELSPEDLGKMCTYIDIYRIEKYGKYKDIRDNPYCAEICKRAGNYDKFMDKTISIKERRRAFDNACLSFGFSCS